MQHSNNKYHSMKTVFIFSLLCLNCLSAICQIVTGSPISDNLKRNQIYVMEMGAGTLDDPYYLLHNSYKKTAHETSKSKYRAENAFISSPSQVGYADTIKTKLQYMADTAAIYIANCKLKTSWAAEQNRFASIRQEINNNLSYFSEFGGNINDYQSWQDQYEQLNYALNVANSGFIPDIERKKQYMKIYDEYVSLNRNLRMATLQTYFQRHGRYSTNLAGLSKHVKDSMVISQSHSRWVDAAVHVVGTSTE